jgi:hypothetical protein
MAVPRDHGKVIWHERELPVLRETLSTGTHVLSRHQGTDWMRRIPTLTAAVLDYHGGKSALSTSALSTGCVQAELLMERTEPDGPADKKYRYYRHLLARVGDRWFMTAADRDLEGFDHWEPERPTRIEELLACSTSTGW